MTTTENRYSVKAGYCYGANERSCLLSGSDCADGKWVSALDMLDWGGPGSECPRQETLRSLSFGTCDDDDHCSPNAESCANPGSFIKSGGGSSSSCRLDATLFGSCGNGDGDDNVVCRYSPSDCPLGAATTWTFPDDRCTCDQVAVGACRHHVHTDVLVCAVNEQACDEQISTWIPVDRLAAEASGRECFLCRPNSTAAPPQEFQPPQEEKDTSSQETSSAENTMLDKDTGSSISNKEIVILGASVGGTVVLAMGASFWLWRRNRRRKTDHNIKSSLQGSLDAPTNVIFNVSKREGDEEQDDVSVL